MVIFYCFSLTFTRRIQGLSRKSQVLGAGAACWAWKPIWRKARPKRKAIALIRECCITVTGDWNMTGWFSHSVWESSYQLTFIFFRGIETTNQITLWSSMAMTHGNSWWFHGIWWDFVISWDLNGSSLCDSINGHDSGTKIGGTYHI